MQELEESTAQANALRLNPVVTLDLETAGLDWKTDKILLNGFTICQHGDIYYAETHEKELRSLLSNPDVSLRGHNIKFDALFLSNNGYDIQCQLEDTRVMAYCTWPDLEDHSLKSLVREKLGGSPTELGDIRCTFLKKDLPYVNEDDYFCIGNKFVRKDLLISYHKEDIRNVERLYEKMAPNVPDWYWDVEKPLTKMLFEMERRGFPLDRKKLEQLEGSLTSVLKTAFDSVGVENPNSSAQLLEKLKEKGYDLAKTCSKTDKGAYQIDASLLKRLSRAGDVWAKNLLEYRSVKKLLSTYITPFLEKSSSDNRLYGSFNQAGSEDENGNGTRGTHTGRLSSANPNLQNIPARTEIGKTVRSCFVASEGRLMFDSDLKQIEPRYIAHYAQPPKLLNAFKNGLDTHGLFGSDIFEKPVLSLSKIERFIGKTSWLATFYGCSPQKLLFICENLLSEPLDPALYAKHSKAFSLLPKVPNKHSWGDSQESLRKEFGEDAEVVAAKRAFFAEVQSSFKKKNPELMGWREAHINRTRRLGYVVTYGGRSIRVDGINAKSQGVRLSAERKAVNYQIQGSAADAMKLIMLKLQEKLVLPGHGSVFAVVHDEAVGDLVDESKLQIVKDCMEKTFTLRNVPVESDTKLVTNWGEK